MFLPLPYSRPCHLCGRDLTPLRPKQINTVSAYVGKFADRAASAYGLEHVRNLSDSDDSGWCYYCSCRTGVLACLQQCLLFSIVVSNAFVNQNFVSLPMEPNPKKLLDQVRDALRLKHYGAGSITTAISCCSAAFGEICGSLPLAVDSPRTVTCRQRW